MRKRRASAGSSTKAAAAAHRDKESRYCGFLKVFPRVTTNRIVSWSDDHGGGSLLTATVDGAFGACAGQEGGLRTDPGSG